MVKKIWRCKKCKSVQVSDSSVIHKMDYCKCKKSAVDYEGAYTRIINPKLVEMIE